MTVHNPGDAVYLATDPDQMAWAVLETRWAIDGSVKYLLARGCEHYEAYPQELADEPDELSRLLNN